MNLCTHPHASQSVASPRDGVHIPSEVEHSESSEREREREREREEREIEREWTEKERNKI